MKIITNGNVVLPTGVEQVELAFEYGKIVAIDKKIERTYNCEIIDAQNGYVFPGFIDAHTHLDMNNGFTTTADNFASGTKAAVAGGTTTILDFATQDKGDTLSHALENWHQKADNNCYCNYGFHMAITDWNESTRKEIYNMVKQGVSSFKIYFAYDALKVNDRQCLEILQEIKKFGGILGCHCENGDIVNSRIENLLTNKEYSCISHPKSRPPFVEAEAVNRLLSISYSLNYPVNIVHLSSKEALDEVRKFRKKGLKVWVETCPQYMLLDESRYTLPNFNGAKYVISPPLRPKEDVKEIVNAVVNEEIDTIATDHCSYNFETQKKYGIDDFSKIPNGAPGLEHRVTLFYSNFVANGKVSPLQMAKYLSENPAKLFGMGDRKGKLEVGYDADIVILDTKVTEIISAEKQIQNVDYTPYENFEICAKPRTVIVNGKFSVRDFKIIEEKNGIFVKRKAGN